MFYRLIESTLSFSLCVSTNRSISVLRVSSPKNIPTELCACALAIALFANVETVGVSNELRSRAVTLSQLICLAFVIGATFSVCSWISWIEKSNFEHELEREKSRFNQHTIHCWIDRIGKLHLIHLIIENGS